MKKRIYKLFLTLIVSLSLSSGPIVQNEIRKMLEALSRTSYEQIKEFDEEENEDLPYL